MHTYTQAHTCLHTYTHKHTCACTHTLFVCNKTVASDFQIYYWYYNDVSAH